MHVAHFPLRDKRTSRESLDTESMRPVRFFSI